MIWRKRNTRDVVAVEPFLVWSCWWLLGWFLSSLVQSVPGDYCSTTISCQYKAPNSNTSLSQVEQWKEEDEALWDYVNSQVPAVLDHTGSSAFDEHLKGVQAVLRYWKAPDHLTKAGLFHSIYGTEGFQGFALPLSEREAIRSMIGPQAEKICFIFCMVDRWTVDQSVLKWKPGDDWQSITFTSRPELGRFNITLDKEEWLDFLELTLADWLEQVEGASSKSNKLFLWKVGQAYSYRRTAYQKMTELLAIERSSRLGEIAPQMLQDVMATEVEETRHLLQLRTPPMSKAADDALAALRAIGEDIPNDFSPQPLLLQHYPPACEAAAA